jgi:hypothetical protein
METNFYDYCPDEFKNASSFNEQQEILNKWIYHYHLLCAKNYDYNYSSLIYPNEATFKLVTNKFKTNIFGDNADIQTQIIKYLQTLNIKCLKVVVQLNKHYPPKPCLEKDIDYYEVSYSLLLTCVLINFNTGYKLKKLRLNNINTLEFYPLTKAKNGSLNIQTQFDIVYFEHTLNFAVITSSQDLINFVNLIKTCTNAYNKALNQARRQNALKQKVLEELVKVPPELLILNASVDWYDLICSSRTYPEPHVPCV